MKFRAPFSALLLSAVVAAGPLGCAIGPPPHSLSFTAMERIEVKFERGVSDQNDVQKLLGAPAGRGNAVWPTEPRPRQVWYYPDIEVMAAKSRQGEHELAVTLWHRFLLIFFDGNKFDGFLWYSNTGDGEAKDRDIGLLGRSMMGQIEYGWPPRTDPIETLKVGISSAADVLLALGEPRGNGAVRFPSNPTLRQIWFYEQTRIDQEWRVHLKILLVFLRDRAYDGHIWFSSVQPSGEKR